MPANKEYRFRIREAFFEGICVMHLSGLMTLAAGSRPFRKFFRQKLTDGGRFFVMDCDGLTHVDSSGMGELVSALTTINMRSGKLVLVNCQTLMKFLAVTKLTTVFEIADDLPKAFSLFGVKAVKGQLKIDYEEKFSITSEEIDGKPTWVENDNISETPRRSEYAIQEIPPKESKEFGPKLLVYVVVSFVVVLGLLISGLVWAVRVVSSIPLLTLIFSVALLFLLILVILVLLLSGHLSEKAASKLLGGVLGKVPGLSVWRSKASTKGKN